MKKLHHKLRLKVFSEYEKITCSEKNKKDLNKHCKKHIFRKKKYLTWML